MSEEDEPTRFCTSCGKQLKSKNKYCSGCGLQQTITDTVENVFIKRDSPLPDESLCQLCGEYAPTKYVDLYQNIGLLIARQHKNIAGELCRSCIARVFWRFTLITLILGWWSVISFIITPFIILNNLWRYLSSLTLPNKINS